MLLREKKKKRVYAIKHKQGTEKHQSSQAV